MLHHILNNRGEIKDLSEIITPVHPLRMEYETIKRMLGKKIEYLKKYCKANFGKLLLTIKSQIGMYNVYGRIILKRYKDCTYYYMLLNENKKTRQLDHCMQLTGK